MHTTHDDPRPSTHLRTVQDFLEQLGQLKTEGLGARERLDFIRKQGSSLLEGDELQLEDAFDVENRVRSQHLDKLRGIDHALESLAALWAQGPFSEEVREAGQALLGHAEGFVVEAKRREEASATEMLGLLWERAPADLRWLYPWLNAWDGPVKAPSQEAVQMYGVPATHYEGFEAPPEPQVPVSYEEEREHERRLPTEHLEGIEQLEKQAVEKAETPEPVKIEVPEPETRGFPVTRIDEAVSVVEEGRVVAKVGEKATTDEAPDPDKLRERVWTQALRDVTLERWQLRVQAHGHIGGVGMGTALIWQNEEKSAHEARLEMIDLLKSASGIEAEPSEDAKFEVRLYVDSPKLGRRSLSKTMTRKELDELHLDPAPFVEEAFKDK